MGDSRANVAGWDARINGDYLRESLADLVSVGGEGGG